MILNVKQEQVKELYSRAPSGTIGQVFVALFMTYILYGEVSNSRLIPWTLVILSILALRVIAMIAFYKGKAHTHHIFSTKTWILIYQINVLFTGISWGILSYLFTEQYQILDMQLVMVSIIFAIAGIGVVSLGPIFSVYVFYSVPMISMISIHWLISDKPFHYEVASLLFLGLAFLLIAAFQFYRRTLDLIQRTHEVERNQLDIIERLGRAGEFKDNETGSHVKRMSYSSYLLALECGLSEHQADQIYLASPMHDIGKIGIPDNILLKPGKLNNEEWDIMKTHTTIGAELLDSQSSQLLQLASSIAANHHEKWDGSGYPAGLSGQDIPLEARIVCICDEFDALVSKRPYKEAWSLEDALAFIKEQSGKHFDPKLVEHFLLISPQIIEYRKKHVN